MTLKTLVYLKLRTPKTWLDKCLKSHASEDLLTSNMVNVRSTVEIYITDPLSYSSTIANEIELEKVSLIDMQNLGRAC